MRFLGLATDYDGTIAHHGYVDRPTIEALQRFKDFGGKLLLVTGRELHELLGIFPELPLFDLAVLENGALLYEPITRREECLAKAPPEEFANRLRERGVASLSVGNVVVATVEQYCEMVQQTIDELELELEIILNKGSVMVLPRGIDKAFGLRVALERLQLPAERVVGIGDAENDYVFLAECGYSAAVANALPRLKTRVDYVCGRDHGAGVVELIEHLVEAQPNAVASTL